MPKLETPDGASIAFAETGDGIPLLAIAPGGMRSAMDFWSRAPFDPREVLPDLCRVVTMDQRNAGASTGPVSAEDGWDTFARDQLALLDHLGIERCVVMGMCIGGPYVLNLLRLAPERFSAGVLLQPIGLDDNRAAFHEMFDGWANDLAPKRPDVPAEAWAGMRSNMYDGDFLFAVDRDFVRGCSTPLLVARGDDLYHPAVASEEVVELAPNAELIRDWKEGAGLDAAVRRVREFLVANAT